MELQKRLLILHKLRFKKLRLWTAYPFVILYFFFAYRDGIDFNPGIWFVIAGLFIRLWASGIIKKRRALTTAGPYSFVRNPLYLGSFLAGFGFCLFVKNIFLLLIFIFLFFIFYKGTIKEEETLLADIFGQEYLDYKKAVPSFFPSFKRYKPESLFLFDFRQVLVNGEIIRILVTGILLSILYGFQGFFKKSSCVHLTAGKFIFIYIILLLLLISSIIHRRYYIRREDKRKS